MSKHVSEWLNAYHDGELHGSQLHQVEAHLAVSRQKAPQEVVVDRYQSSRLYSISPNSDAYSFDLAVKEYHQSFLRGDSEP